MNKSIPTPEEFMVYGTAGKSMGKADFREAFGKETAASGSRGEQILLHEMRKPGGIVPASIPVICSMNLPGYSSDIDFAVAMGNKVLLIDAKYYRQDGGVYWNTKGDRSKMYRNLSRYRTKSGKEIHLSNNDIAAENIIGRKLKNTEVSSIVVFVSDKSLANAKEPHVFMKFPGEVKAVSMKNFKREFVKFFHNSSGYNNVTHNNIKYLSSLCQ